MSQEPSFETMNEQDVREIIIRPLIESLGYRHGTDATIITEKTLRYDHHFLGRKDPKKDPRLQGRADYICDVISFGRWVVEVKAPSEDLSQDVVEQAHTYAAHPEIAATFFLVSNGRRFRLFETGKLQHAVLEWNHHNSDDNLLRLFNVLSPAAFRKRASLTLVDPGKPLGKGLASRLRIIGGEILYEEHQGSHPFIQAQSMKGLRLPVTGGYVTRDEDRRIKGHLKVAKSAPMLQQLNAVMGIADDYDFFSATEFLSQDRENPSIFQNVVASQVAVGTIITLPGLPRFPMPLELTSNSYTEAIGYVDGDNFIGMMRLTYDFGFSKISPQVRNMLPAQFGHIPATAHMTGSGRFEILLQGDI
jgi:Type I restriction enzyme R protein N terminus (HSDR_N)